jgi:enamine deaminase RidA (YjgF/YER057c/UK114 family)
MPIQYINSDALMSSPAAFTNLVSVSGNVKTIYIGGIDAVKPNGELVGKGNLGAQVTQVLENLQAALAGIGASVENIVKWNVYLRQGQSTQEAFASFGAFWKNRPNPPAITLLFVAGMDQPDYLVEIEAVAVIPE